MAKEIQISETKLNSMERQTLQKVTMTVSAIENAINVWNSSKSKPKDLQSRLTRLKNFHEQLTSWGKKFGNVKKQRVDMGKRIEVLREFVELCYRYKNT